MTPRKKATTGKRQTRKLKLNKETLKDLDTRRKASEVKGGAKGSVGNDWNCTLGNDWNCGGGGTQKTCGNCW
jgi:hypothetical protein